MTLSRAVCVYSHYSRNCARFSNQKILYRKFLRNNNKSSVILAMIMERIIYFIVVAYDTKRWICFWRPQKRVQNLLNIERQWAENSWTVTKIQQPPREHRWSGGPWAGWEFPQRMPVNPWVFVAGKRMKMSLGNLWWMIILLKTLAIIKRINGRHVSVLMQSTVCCQMLLLLLLFSETYIAYSEQSLVEEEHNTEKDEG